MTRRIFNRVFIQVSPSGITPGPLCDSTMTYYRW